MPVQHGRSDGVNRGRRIITARAWRTFSDDDQMFAGVSVLYSGHSERRDVPAPHHG